MVRDNHLGDWGSQFGMILWGWKNARDEASYAADPVGELARLYRLAQDRIKEGDAAVKAAAQAETAKLHAGDPENRALWSQFMPHCLGALQALYDRLGVRFDVQLGESFYDPMLASVVADLEGRGLAVASEGAIVVSRRTDRGAVHRPQARWCLQLCDHRPGDHQVSRRDLAPRSGSLRRRPSPGGPFQAAFRGGSQVGIMTRSGSSTWRSARSWARIAARSRRGKGDVVGLESLLDESTAEALKVVKENSPELDPAEQRQVAAVVGLGAIKYADLSQNRISDYVFDWQKMMAKNGNTATYMQYAYARTRSVFRKAGIAAEAIREQRPAIALSHPAERGIGVRLLRLPEVLEFAA